MAAMRNTIASCLLLWSSCGNQVISGGSDGGSDGSAIPDGGSAPDLTMNSCKPDCSGRLCGSDGCNGSCGSCPQNQLCGMDGQCAAPSGPLTVDVGSVGGAIAPEIYGLAFADPATLKKLNIPVNRWGGNGTSRYNWQLDVHNTGNDYYYENIVDDTNDGYGTNNYVSSADRFVSDNQSAAAATLMTIPTIGWTPKDRVAQHPFTCGFPVSKYGAQQSVDPYDKNCGNGVAPNGSLIAGDPTTTSIAAPPSFETQWLSHLIAKFGSSTGNGIRYYQMDNEMMLWDSTHRDVHPMPVSYDEVWQTTSNYGPVIKAADPNATLLGYTAWGVLDLFESGVDTKNNNNNDQKAHGGLPLAEWYLSQLAGYEKANGKRLVDCLDLHYYPQGGDPLDNTRSLWDPTYHDPSWVDQFLGEPVQLFPRLSKWIAAQYPGTSVCVSEYNFNLGSESDPKSALVEADVLGIFGKYGVRLAAWWTTPVDGNGNLLPPAEAFRMYRNYDGAGGAFGAISVAAASTVNGVALYAAKDADGGRVTIVVINKTNAPAQTTLGLANFNAAGAVQSYQYVAANGAQLTKGPDLLFKGGMLPLSLPGLSMTLLIAAKQ